MFKFNASKKVYKDACRIYRELWENVKPVYFERQSIYNNIVRLSGSVSGINYQIHIESFNIAERYHDTKNHKETDTFFLRVFAVACACADSGKRFNDFAHIVNGLVLNA